MDMDGIVIRKYDPKEHREVLDLVVKGLSSNKWTAYKNTLNSTKIPPTLCRMLFHLWLWRLFSDEVFLLVGVIIYELVLYHVVIGHFCVGGYLRYKNMELSTFSDVEGVILGS